MLQLGRVHVLQVKKEKKGRGVTQIKLFFFPEKMSTNYLKGLYTQELG